MALFTDLFPAAPLRSASWQVERLHTLLRPHLLRRMKTDVMQQLPPKKEQIVAVELSAAQKQARAGQLRLLIHPRSMHGSSAACAVQAAAWALGLLLCWNWCSSSCLPLAPTGINSRPLQLLSHACRPCAAAG